MVIEDPTTRKLTPVSVNLLNLKVINFNDDVIDNWGSLRVTNYIFSDNKISGAIISNYDGSYCKITHLYVARKDVVKA